MQIADKNGVTPLTLACENDADLSLLFQCVRSDQVAIIGHNPRVKVGESWLEKPKKERPRKRKKLPN